MIQLRENADEPFPGGFWSAASRDEDTQLRSAGFWWACEHPERPPDADVIWHKAEGDPCPGCQVSAGMLLRVYPENPEIQWLNRTVNR